MNRKWRWVSTKNFFGLSDKYMETVYEQFFYMKYYGGWSFMEAYNLPIGLRTWFIERLAKQKKEEAEQYNKTS